MSRSPTQGEVINAGIARALEGLHTAIPASVTRYDATQCLCDAQPLIKSSYVDESGNTVVEDLPVVCNVPVVFSGGGGFRLTFPLAKDDVVLLVFTEASLDVWLKQGGKVDPGDPRRFNLSDAIAIPGLRPFGGAKKAGAAHTTMPALVREASKIGFYIGADDVLHVGTDTAAKALALAEKVDNELAKLKTHFTAVESVLTGLPINEPGSGSPSALQTALHTAITASPYPTPTTTASTRIKADS